MVTWSVGGMAPASGLATFLIFRLTVFSAAKLGLVVGRWAGSEVAGSQHTPVHPSLRSHRQPKVPPSPPASSCLAVSVLKEP